MWTFPGPRSFASLIVLMEKTFNRIFCLSFQTKLKTEK
jgi:hypothetical protein